MDCEIIKTKFGGDLLYVPAEKMLYSFKIERNHSKQFECYQQVLADAKKKDSANVQRCTSSVKLLPNGKCARVNIFIPHTKHTNHEMIAADKRKMNKMTDLCENLRINHPEDAHKIPSRHIFQHAIAV